MNGNLLLVVCLSTLRKLVADIGTPCTVTSDCNTTTVAGTVCDTIMSPPVCKLGSAANCTNNQDDCASNSSCIANACRCTVFTHTEETSTKLCKKDIGQTCAGLTDCVISQAVCDATEAVPVCKLAADQSCVIEADCAANSECRNSTCSCRTGYMKQADKSCLPGLGTACSSTLACDRTANTGVVCDNTNVCKLPLGATCIASTDCVSGASCSTICSCSKGYIADVPYVLCLEEPIACAASTENGIVWPEALDGHISRNRSCPEGYQGDIYRRCENGIYLNPVNNCTRRAIQDLHAQVFNGSLNSTEALSKLKQATNTWTAANENLPTTGDLQTLNQILDKVIDDIELNSTTVENVADSVFEVANNLLDESSTSSWKSLVNDKGVGADSVITTIDRFISKVVNSSATVLNMTFDMPNLFAEIGQVDSCEHIMFPSTTIKAEKANKSKQVFSGGLFKNMSGMLPSTSNDIDSLDSSINGPVLSFSFHRQAIRTVDVRITFHIFDRKLTDPSCLYWETNQSRKGRWSTDGCILEQFDREKGTVTCHCNHLTNFAVLMSPTSITETNTVHQRRLRVLSIVGCSISIIGLVLTITTIVFFWKALRSRRSILLLNLCSVLLLAYVIFLAGVDKTSQHAVCTSIAVLLHYIFLTAFFLMLSEGCIIAQVVLRPFDKRNYLPALLGISYGMPLVVVSISAAASKLNGYGNDKFCWLSIDSGLFWAFAGPALTVIFVNTIISVAVIKTMFGTSAISKRTDADKIKTGIRSVCVLLPVFGITWLFGVFAVNRETSVFQYLFVIFNSLQGLLIFIVQCILDRKVQEAFKARLTRWFATEVSATATEMKARSSKID
ncbi:adhesion G protein-coupled receptor L3-like isoform X3 [Mya arenaria]|uniref:adhesion G protein-coupled receptor L3-like isoform X3 n=1 Tax=Mya arenaria TaxID=6604 RepID=UPI0022E106C9|nr:adhesion G protein-coupled receptor L3-like isoform X3 [Mya arenaria]